MLNAEEPPSVSKKAGQEARLFQFASNWSGLPDQNLALMPRKNVRPRMS